MRYLITVIICTIWTSSAQYVSAEQQYENDCDGTVLFECNKIAAKYREPSFFPPPFPHDPARADALVRTAIDGALVGCGGSNYDLCFTLSDLLLRFTTQPDDPRYSDLGRMTAYIAGTEAGCDKGIATACYCYWRSVAFHAFMPETYEIGVQLEMAKGLTRLQAETTMAQTKQAYQNRATSAAASQVQQLRTTPKEHLPLVLNACTTVDRTTCAKLSGAIFTLGMAPVTPENLTLKAATLQSLNTTCAAGNAAHCLILSEEGRSDPTLNSFQFLTAACTHGASDACLSLALRHLYISGDTKNSDDLQPATDLLEQACDLHDNTACHILEHLTKG